MTNTENYDNVLLDISDKNYDKYINDISRIINKIIMKLLFSVNNNKIIIQGARAYLKLIKDNTMDVELMTTFDWDIVFGENLLSDKNVNGVLYFLNNQFAKYKKEISKIINILTSGKYVYNGRINYKNIRNTNPEKPKNVYSYHFIIQNTNNNELYHISFLDIISKNDEEIKQIDYYECKETGLKYAGLSYCLERMYCALNNNNFAIKHEKTAKRLLYLVKSVINNNLNKDYYLFIDKQKNNDDVKKILRVIDKFANMELLNTILKENNIFKNEKLRNDIIDVFINNTNDKLKLDGSFDYLPFIISKL